ncbi:hypothetical protein RHMOL_Rhmol01G0126000 [Rhododendron molle]|uniref:Uncharacterized protein n=1 Tax=Rhododendron molle TaxID=49168 RepID=A0ACC0Q250_RHOML|nr:hypothetical protein RHMOL_Rhmol01G0126000 [Rhododendron molle]
MGRFRRFCNTPQTMADFRSHYEIADNIATELALVDALRESPDEDILHIPVEAVVEGGVRFPLAPLLRQVLAFYRVSPMQVSANFFRAVMGINTLNQMLGTSLGLHDIHHLYSISRTKDALTYYLKKVKPRSIKDNHRDPSTIWTPNLDDNHRVQRKGELLNLIKDQGSPKVRRTLQTPIYTRHKRRYAIQTIWKSYSVHHLYISTDFGIGGTMATATPMPIVYRVCFVGR